MDLLLPGRVEPVRQSPRTIAYGSFTHGTDPHHRPYSSGVLVSSPTTSAGRLPQPTRLPIARSRGFHPASGTIRPSDDSPSVASHFAFAYRVAYPGATREPCESSWGHAQIFRTVPPANTLVRWVDENAFAPIVRARPCPTFGRPVHLRDSSLRLRPGTSPHAFRIPPRGGHPALRRTPRKWLQVRLGCLRLSPSCPFRVLHTRFLSPASEALPPPLDMPPLIRAPEGLEPSGSRRCPAHTTAPSDSRCATLDFAFGLYERPCPDVGRADGSLLFRTEP